MRFRNALCLAVLVSIFQNVGVHGASDTNPVDRLPEVLVEAGSYEEILREMWNIPGGVELITAPEIDRTRATNLKDAINMVPGVYIQPRQGAADESSLSIRGSGIRNNFHLRGIRLYWDGMLMSHADGFSDFDAIELLAVDNIQIYKGANGLALGGNSLGGAINFVSKTGFNSEAFKIRAEGGSFGFVRGQLSSGQNFPSDVDYYVSGTALNEDGFRDHQKVERERFIGNFGWQPQEDTQLRFYLFAVNSRNQLAGNLTKAQLYANPKQAAAANITLNQRRDTEYLRGAVSAVHTIDSNQRLELNTYYMWQDLDHPLGFAWVDNEFNDTGFGLRYINSSELCGNENEFIFGVTPQYGRVLDANFVNNSGSRGAMTKNQVDETYNLGTWIQDTYSFAPDWKAILGTRLDYTRYQLRDRLMTNGDQSGGEGYSGFSPRAGLIYEFTPQIQAYGNLSYAYEPPVFGELTLNNNSGLVDLQAQKSFISEVGTRGQWDRFDWDFSVYDAEIDGELFQNTNGATSLSVLTNIPCTRHLGVEFGSGIKLWEGIADEKDYIRLASSYTWSDFTILEDGPYTNNELPGVPEQHLVTEISYHHPIGFYYIFSVENANDYYVDKANGLIADGFTVFGMRSGMEFKNGINLFAEIRNLTDVTYASAISTLERATPASAQFKPADGFAVYGGAEWKY